MVGYMGFIDVFPTHCPGPDEGPGNNPKGGKLARIVFVHNIFWNVVVITPIPDYIWAYVTMGGTKPGGKPYIGVVFMAIVLITLGAWVVIACLVAHTGVKTSSKGWETGEFSPSLFTSSLEEEFLYDGVFDLAMLDKIVPLLKIMH